MLFLKNQSLHYVFFDSQAVSDAHAAGNLPGSGKGIIRGHGVEVMLEGSSPVASPTGLRPLEQRETYLLGKDPARWSSNVPAYGEVLYKDIYPGIDLRLFAYYQTLKYEFIVRPGADPSRIRLRYEGASLLQTEGDQLLVGTSLNPFREGRPYSFVEKQGKPVEVPAHWQVEGQTARFRFPQGYDRSLPLTIDPTLVFSTYTGSKSDNWGHTATYDDQGNLYTAGVVFGRNLQPTRGAFQMNFRGDLDLAILKFNPDGNQLLYATYLGGRGGEAPNSLIVNSKGELVIYGVTSSPDFPVTTGAYSTTFRGGPSVSPAGNGGVTPSVGDSVSSIQFRNGTDLFVAKLSANGQALTAATLIGGSANDGLSPASTFRIRNYGDDLRGEVGLDGADNVYVATVTASADFPIVGGSQTQRNGPTDGVIFRLSADLRQLQWSTYLGGGDTDATYGLKVTPTGTVYVCGVTRSADLPSTATALRPRLSGTEDGFVARFDNQSLSALTYLGTDSADVAYLLDLDASQNVHVFGLTRGTYPVTEGTYRVAGSRQFIHALDPMLSRTLFSTVVGSGRPNPDIVPTAFMINECGNIYLSGWGGATNTTAIGVTTTSTLGLPVTEDALKTTTTGNNFWIAVLERNARSLLYATFFGSNAPGPGQGNQDRGDHVDGGTSRFAKSGVIYHAVCACGGTRFPTTPQAWSRTNNSANCNNAAFKIDIDQLKASFDTYQGTQKGVVQGCAPLSLTFVNTSLGGQRYEWDLGGLSRTDSRSQATYTFDKPGEYTITLRAFNRLTCQQVDVAQQVIKVFPANFSLRPDTTICPGQPVTLQASGGKTYAWTPAQGLSATNVAGPVATVNQTTRYTVTITNEFGCVATRNVTIQTDDSFRPRVEARTRAGCAEATTVELLNRTAGADSVRWTLGNGQTINSNAPPSFQYAPSGQYVITATAYKGACSLSVELPVTIENLNEVPNVITPNGDGKNDVFDVGFRNARLEIFNRWGKPIYQADTYANDWGPGVPAGTYHYLLTTPTGTRCKGWIMVME